MFKLFHLHPRPVPDGARVGFRAESVEAAGFRVQGFMFRV